jgi:hypothetical protein
MYQRCRVGTELNQLHRHAPLALQKLKKEPVFHQARAPEHQLRCGEQRRLGQVGQQRLPKN